MIISGKADPSFIVSRESGIDEASGAYEKFDKRIDGYTKVLIHPNGPLPEKLIKSEGVVEGLGGRDAQHNVLVHD